MHETRETCDADLRMPVLSVNAGSSSLKFGFHRVDAVAAELVFSGKVEFAADSQGVLSASDGDGRTLRAGQVIGRDPQQAIASIQRLLADLGLPDPCAIGHRIVHGGVHVRRHCLIDAAVLKQLQAATAFAPLHVPPALALLDATQASYPSVPQVACLDTAFHADLPKVASTLPIPRELRAQGIQRYGFHGLSCESIVRQLGDDLPQRVVIAHLGNGASVTAVENGKSIDTSMGLTPSGGVIMGTRCGDLDPGVLAYLMREKQFDAVQIESLIDHRCGLLGISGISSDMRRLHAASAGNTDARLAIEMFCHSVRKQIAAMTAALGGIDLLVLTGGIGENDEVVRAAILARLSWLGVTQASDAASRCEVRVLHTQEEQQIAMHAQAISSAIRDVGAFRPIARME